MGKVHALPPHLDWEPLWGTACGLELMKSVWIVTPVSTDMEKITCKNCLRVLEKRKRDDA